MSANGRQGDRETQGGGAVDDGKGGGDGLAASTSPWDPELPVEDYPGGPAWLQQGLTLNCRGNFGGSGHTLIAIQY